MAAVRVSSRQQFIFRAALCTFACALLSAGVRAQDTSEKTIQKGPATYETETKSGTVVYVSGNELVVKGDNGVVKHFTVPDSATATVDGQQLTVHQLKPGMHLTQTITTIMTAGSRAECSICGGPLEGNPAGFAVVSPYDVDQMAQATGGGICMSCIEPAETLLDRATEAFRQIVPDLRVLATPSAPGHA